MSQSVVYIDGAQTPYQEGKVKLSNDEIVNSGFISFEAEPSFGQNSVIEIYNADESQKQFTGRIVDIKEKNLWEATFYGQEYELTTQRLNRVYTDISPEGIVQDIIDNLTVNLNYVSTETSGVTLDEYIATEYKIETVRKMMDILGWQLIIGADGDVRFSSDTFIDNGVTLTYLKTGGSNISVESWETESRGIVNSVEVTGGFRSFNKEETVTGSGTSFTLQKKPNAGVRVVVGGTEQDPSTYTVDAETQTVTFDSSVTDPSFRYDFDRPIIVKQVKAGVPDEEIQEKRINAPWLTTNSDLRQYAKEYVRVNSVPAQRAKATYVGLNWELEVGELVTVNDEINGKTGKYVLSEITHNFGENQTKLNIGTRELRYQNKISEIQRRIKELERQSTNEDVVTISRFISGSINISVNFTLGVESRKVNDTFYFNHETLGRMKDGSRATSGEPEDIEADCSDNGRVGEHTRSGGVAVSGQFTNDGFLGPAVDMSQNQSIAWLNPNTEQPSNWSFDAEQSLGYSYKNKVSASVEEVIYRQEADSQNYLEVSRLPSGEHRFVLVESGSTLGDVTTTAQLDDGDWHRIVLVLENAGGFTVYVDSSVDSADTFTVNTTLHTSVEWQGGDYYLDDFKKWSAPLTVSNVEEDNKAFLVSESSLVLWWSFDNPRLGERYSAKTTIK